MIPFIKETFFIKAFFLLMATVEAGILWYLYYYGYEKIKHSCIINNLQKLFFSLMLLFAALAITPILGIGNVTYAMYFSNYFTWIFIIPVIYYMIRFRQESTNDHKKKK